MRNHGSGSIINRPGTDNLYIRWRVGRKQYQEAVGSSKREDAEKLLATKIGDGYRGITPVHKINSVTYEDVRAAYLKFKPEQANYSSLGLIDAFFKGMRVTQITRSTMEDFIEHRREVDEVSDATIARNLKWFRAAFRRAAKIGLVGQQNVPAFDMPSEPTDGVGQYVNPKQFAEILKHLPKNLHPLYIFLYGSACRLGAAMKITWSMVNADCTEISLPAAITKNRKPLTLLLSGPLEPLAKMLRRQFRDMNAPVFCTLNYRRRFSEAVAKAGLGTFDEKKRQRRSGPRIHDCRVSAAINLLDAGVDRDLVLKIGGWKTDAMLRRYNILDRDRLAAAMEKLAVYVEAKQA